MRDQSLSPKSGVRSRIPQALILAASACLATCLAAPSAAAGDREFDDIVRHIETHYHARRSDRFVLGFASVVVRVARSEGVKGFKIALFENHAFASAGHEDALNSIAQKARSLGWQPMVRVWSRRTGERTYVYAQDCGSHSPDVKLLVVTMEPDEAVVVEVQINPDRLSKMMDDPVSLRRVSKPEND